MDIKQMVDELFDVFDVNNDGVISRGEFVALAKSLLDEKELQFSSDIFREFDANHDNAISKDELIAMVIELAL
jgi:guanylate cyclase activator 1